MIIQHNLMAMNANRRFNISSKKQAKVTEKLSSGYKINRSADDAAGLAISEKMRRQIRGLTQASLNAQDGISMVQIADGAMAEIQDMLHRGSELSIKAANGTLNQNDRSYIQMEIKQLKEEIDGISERTTFNEIQVLRGNIQPDINQSTNVIIKGSMPAWAAMGSNGNMGETYQTTEQYETTSANGTSVITGFTIEHDAATIDFSPFDGSQAMINDLVGNGFYATCCTCTAHYSIRFTDEATSSETTSAEHHIYNIGIKDVQNADELLNRIIQGTDNGYPNSHYTKLAVGTNKKLIIYDDRSNSADPQQGQNGKWVGWDNPAFNVKAHDNYGKFGPGTAYSAEDPRILRNPAIIPLQIGSEAGQHLDIELPSISTRLLGIYSVDVSTPSGAEKGINAFKGATAYVSEERSRMGAYQNRLDHTIRNLDNVVENTQASESVIRDADMAKMMVEFSNNSILIQASQSMLAQANQSQQGILQLLQ